MLTLMQEHIYIAKKKRIIRQSFFIWLFVGLQVAANTILIPTLFTKNQIGGIVIINILLGLITIPAVILFFKYYRHSVGKKFIVTYNSLKFVDDKTGQSIELNSSEIDKIYLVVNNKTSRLPWLFHEYFSFIDTRNNKITITSYFMDISDFWLDTLTRKVNSNKVIREEKTYPII
jgi:hypothetical protein